MAESTLFAPTAALNPVKLKPVNMPSGRMVKAGLSFAGVAAAAVGILGPSGSNVQQHNASAQAQAATASQGGPATLHGSTDVSPPPAPQPAPASDPNMLQEGANGPAVVQVQRALGTQADGVFGPQTRANVVTYQSNHGLATDGVVGPRTHQALFTPARSSSSHTTTHASSSSSSSNSSASSSSSGFSIPSYIVQCESHGNYHAVNSSTGAGGAYQIEPQTWRAYGGSGSPQNAPKSEQDAIAQKIYQSEGSSPWSCAK